MPQALLAHLFYVIAELHFAQSHIKLATVHQAQHVLKHADHVQKVIGTCPHNAKLVRCNLRDVAKRALRRGTCIDT